LFFTFFIWQAKYLVGDSVGPAGLDGLLFVGGHRLPYCYNRQPPLPLRQPPTSVPDPFTTGLGNEDDGQLLNGELLESAELPAAARIQQEPAAGNDSQSSSIGSGGGEGDADISNLLGSGESDRPSFAALYESGEILHELHAKDTIFYENVTIPESEHDNVVPTGDGERGLPKLASLHGGHTRKAAEEDEIRRRRRHGHR
jgi:hypothetical protein